MYLGYVHISCRHLLEVVAARIPWLIFSLLFLPPRQINMHEHRHPPRLPTRAGPEGFPGRL